MDIDLPFPIQDQLTHDWSILQDILGSCPSSIEATSKKTGGTRQPAPYDQHMDTRLTLKKVVYAPSLPGDLERFVNTFTMTDDGLPRTDLPPTTTLRTLETFSDLELETSAPISYESELAFVYYTRTAKPIGSIATTLAFDLPSWDTTLFPWKDVPVKRDYGIGDGFLRVGPTAASMDTMNYLTEEARQDITNITDHFPNIGIWEFKNLLIGSDNFLKSIVSFSKDNPEFPWIPCTEPGCKIHFRKTGSHMEFDAAQKICSLARPTGQGRKRTKPIVPTKKTLHILQQVWAESVREDATFCIIHSGNHELICYRNRAEGTLYVSDVIDICNHRSGYRKLQVGIYLAMYFDALDRTNQLIEAKASNNLPESWTRVYPISAKVSTHSQGDIEDKKRAENAARACVSVTISLRKGGAFTFNPRRFNRVQSVPDIDTNPEISIETEEQLGVFVYTAKLRVKGVFWEEIVLKLAHNKDDSAKLLHEYQLYGELQRESSIEGIPDVLGCFTSDENPKLNIVALLMRNHGASLVKGVNDVTILHRLGFLQTLKQIHDAGYLHGGLTDSKLLFDANGVKIIGFGNATKLREYSNEDEQKDFHTLAEILDCIQEEYYSHHGRPAKRVCYVGGSNDAVPKAVSAVLLGPMDKEAFPSVSETIKQWVSGEPCPCPVPIKISPIGDCLHLTFLEKPDADSFVKVWYQLTWNPKSRGVHAQAMQIYR